MLIAMIICFSGLYAQENNTLYMTKKIRISTDTIYLEKESLNNSFFKIATSKGVAIADSLYQINFKKGYLLLTPNLATITDSITVNYLKFPDFLTKVYRNENITVVSSDINTDRIYKIDPKSIEKKIPFDGLSTSGSITRGVTIGNNQNSVLNSNLDLQITGKLSDKVSIRASLQDSNIPLQDGGYSQQLDQFDNIFMELFSTNWNIRGGDIFLENRISKFLNFSKKVQGISTSFDFGTATNKTNVFTSAALVRGQYAKSSFTGIEGNQGPYKLKGQNGELYVLVISGSERVYVNGILLKRGENNDYTIDYNAGEIVFTPLFTITSEMRIAIEYQYTDRNYSRFVTYAGVTHESKKWSFGSYLYSENDIKNQPLQQNLSTDQALILANAGDNTTLMIAPSAFNDSFSNNKILYQKLQINGVDYFEYTSNPQAELFNVRFTAVGNNRGDYRIKNENSITRIYEYIAPINGIPQGNFSPVIQLIAPDKIQIATFMGKYASGDKTAIDFEMAVSNNDKNLFSTIDDANNSGVSAKINAKQRLISKKWNLDAISNYQFIQQSFRSVERIFNIEFDRDWNLNTQVTGNQSLLSTGLVFQLNPSSINSNRGNISYLFEKLDFANSFSGNRHLLNGKFTTRNWNITNLGSYLNSSDLTDSSTFIRNQMQIKYNFGANWIGASQRIEDNQKKSKNTNQLLGISQRFSEYGLTLGRGDSTRVYVAVGFLKRTNDSIQNGLLQRVNQSQTFYLKSKLIQTDKSDLSLYTNYRILDFENNSKKKEPSLNSRILYNDRFFNQLVQSNTTYETNSGSIAQQEFTYLEVPVGQGVYTWNDYNGNGIQELQEFEVAPFIDQAKYIRVFLPNRVFVKTHQTKFSQSIILNTAQWQNETGFKKLLSYFYNQTSYLIDRKTKNDGSNFELNPFSASQIDVLGLTSSFRNSLFYNRGKQIHSVTYNYVQNQVKSLLSIGSQESKNNSHQLQYAHLYQKSWLFSFFTKSIQTAITSENYPEKNYKVSGYQIAPKISYLFSKSTSWDIFYELQNKENKIGTSETLLQNRFGSSFSYAGVKKITVNGEISFYQNKFNGDPFSSVGFQMLEGLQQGKNLTWRLLLQKNITQFMDINLNYQGRKSEFSNTIHTGNVQLRAYF